jgi:hypothetical protein
MKKLLGIGIGLATAAVLAVSAMAAGTVTVTGNTTLVENTPGGWMFNRDLGTSTPYAFVAGPASIGVGSIYVSPIGATPANKFIAEFFMQTPIASVNSISYDFQIGAGSPQANAHEHFYMNVYATYGASSPTKFYDCRYNIVPASGSTAAFTTVTFNPAASYTVTTHGSNPANSCPASPAAMGPGAKIRAIALNVGDTGAVPPANVVGSDQGLHGYLDKVVVSLTGDTTTFNFDPYAVATDKDQCKDGGWQTLKRADGSSFKNQGDCVSYTNNGR